MDWSSFPIGNAAGFIKGPGKQFDDMLRSAATFITIGSITLEPRDGNPGTVYELLPDGTSVNALGLPNPGLKAILEVAPEMAKAANEAEKRLRWSVAGFSPEEYEELALGLHPYGDIELNLGCPNVWSRDAGQKPIASFNLEVMRDILTRVSDYMCFDVKVSPYSDPLMITQVAVELKKVVPLRVVTCNTFPNGVANLDTPGGYGGIGGNTMHTIALGQVAQFASALSDTHIKVVGVGGIDSGTRASAMYKQGASAVQIGTAFGERGARIFSDVLEEL